MVEGLNGSSTPRLKPEDLARPVLLALTEMTGHTQRLDDICGFAAHIAGVQYDEAAAAMANASSSIVEELVPSPGDVYKTVVNPANAAALEAADAVEFCTTSGAVIPRDKLARWASAQLAIEAAQTALNTEITNVHQTALKHRQGT